MFRHGSESFIGSFRGAVPERRARAWTVIDDDWRRFGTWRRIIPPAVPFASAWGVDS